MHVAAGAWWVVVVVVAAVGLWRWARAPRRAKQLTPISDGWGQPLQFRPGPALLPEHDAQPADDEVVLWRRGDEPARRGQPACAAGIGEGARRYERVTIQAYAPARASAHRSA